LRGTRRKGELKRVIALENLGGKRNSQRRAGKVRRDGRKGGRAYQEEKKVNRSFIEKTSLVTMKGYGGGDEGGKSGQKEGGQRRHSSGRNGHGESASPRYRVVGGLL